MQIRCLRRLSKRTAAAALLHKSQPVTSSGSGPNTKLKTAQQNIRRQKTTIADLEKKVAALEEKKEEGEEADAEEVGENGDEETEPSASPSRARRHRVRGRRSRSASRSRDRSRRSSSRRERSISPPRRHSSGSHHRSGSTSPSRRRRGRHSRSTSRDRSHNIHIVHTSLCCANYNTHTTTAAALGDVDARAQPPVTGYIIYTHTVDLCSMSRSRCPCSMRSRCPCSTL